MLAAPLRMRPQVMTDNLGAPGWLQVPSVQAIITALEAARAGGSRFVGGCVRNTLMGREVDDIDVATQLTPDAVIAALESTGIRAIPTGIEHGTITAVHEGMPVEITTLRRDVETDGRRAVVAFTTDWAVDAARRDFRLNAIYAEPDGTLHDPTGGGLEDASTGAVIFIGDADQRLREDYLRILRFFRFNAWYGAGIDAQGLAACARHRDGLEQIAAERIWRELEKLLNAPDPRKAVVAMATSGVLSAMLPQAGSTVRLEKLISIETEQLFTHDPVHRLMALLPRDVAVVKAVADRLRLSNALRDRLTEWASDETRFVSYLSARELRRAVYWLGPELFRDRAMLEWASGGGGSDVQWRALIALSDSFVRPDFPVTGEDVMQAGVPKGPLVGKVLHEVETWWVDADFTMDEFSIIERLKAVAQGVI